MTTKIQIKSIFGKVLFEYEAEDNTIKKTLEKAIKENVNLYNADLSDANLSNAKNKELASLPIFCKWIFSIKGDFIKIGCKEKTIEDWDLWFNSTEEYETKRNTDNFKQIQAVYNALKSYHLTLNK